MAAAYQGGGTSIAHSNGGTSPNKFFDYVIKKYFRVKPRVPEDVYIAAIRNKPYYIRQQLAQVSHFPKVVEALAEDVDPLVRQAAFNNEYWEILGQFKPLLKLTKEEKLSFIEKEGFQNLLVFIVFEDDPDVLERVFLNPSISLQMLNSYLHYLESRGFGPKDEQILKRLQQVILLKKNRIVKISKILHFHRFRTSFSFFKEILSFFLEEDPVILQSLLNTLNQLASRQIISYFEELDVNEYLQQHTRHEVWSILEKIYAYRKRGKLKFLDEFHKNGASEKGPDPLLKQINFLKKSLLPGCEENLSLRENLLPVVSAHVDGDPEIRELAAGILSLEETLVLISDESFPRALGNEVFRILKQHPDPELQRQLNQVYMLYGDRIRKKLREMETTINAYFDIIFSSLGFPKIFKIRQALKILQNARELTHPFIHSGNGSYSSDEINQLFEQIEKLLLQRFSQVSSLMDEQFRREILEIYQIVQILLQMPAQMVREEGFSPGLHKQDFHIQLAKAHLLWRTTIGQYLGRIKELNEMIQKKWLSVLPEDISPFEFQEELNRALSSLETNYKQQVGCQKTIACKVCSKRQCASERFLRQLEFMIGELLEDLKVEIEEAEALV